MIWAFVGFLGYSVAIFAAGYISRAVHAEAEREMGEQ